MLDLHSIVGCGRSGDLSSSDCVQFYFHLHLTTPTINRRMITKRRATSPQMGTAKMIMSLLPAAMMELLDVGMTDGKAEHGGRPVDVMIIGRLAKELLNTPGVIPENNNTTSDQFSTTTYDSINIILYAC